MEKEEKGNHGNSKFKEEYTEQAKKLCLLGATDKVLADFFNVTEQTINNWKKDHPQFFESLKKSKIEADLNVSKSLYKRATGYKYTETHLESGMTPQGPVSKEKTVEKEVPADPLSIIFWLKNRQPELWRDKPIEESTNDKDNIKYLEGGKDLNERKK